MIIYHNIHLIKCVKSAMLVMLRVTTDSNFQQSLDNLGSCRCDRRRSFSYVLIYRRTKVNRWNILGNTLDEFNFNLQAQIYCNIIVAFQSLIKCDKSAMLDQLRVIIDSDLQLTINNRSFCRRDRRRSLFNVLNYRRTEMKQWINIYTFHGMEKSNCVRVFIQGLVGQLMDHGRGSILGCRLAILGDDDAPGLLLLCPPGEDVVEVLPAVDGDRRGALLREHTRDVAAVHNSSSCQLLLLKLERDHLVLKHSVREDIKNIKNKYLVVFSGLEFVPKNLVAAALVLHLRPWVCDPIEERTIMIRHEPERVMGLCKESYQKKKSIPCNDRRVGMAPFAAARDEILGPYLDLEHVHSHLLNNLEGALLGLLVSRRDALPRDDNTSLRLLTSCLLMVFIENLNFLANHGNFLTDFGDLRLHGGLVIHELIDLSRKGGESGHGLESRRVVARRRYVVDNRIVENASKTQLWTLRLIYLLDLLFIFSTDQVSETDKWVEFILSEKYSNANVIVTHSC